MPVTVDGKVTPYERTLEVEAPLGLVMSADGADESTVTIDVS
jgi:hypothetical protein